MDGKDETARNLEEITLDPGTSSHTEPPDTEDDSCIDRVERYWKYMKKIWNSRKGYKFIVVCCCIFFVLGIASSVIGALSFGKCPLGEGTIPIWLVAFGPACIILSVVVGVERYVRSIRKRKNYLIQCNCFQRILGLLIFCGYIAGCIFVFGASGRSADPKSDYYCSPVPYFFAIIFLALFSLFIAVIIIILLSFCRRV